MPVNMGNLQWFVLVADADTPVPLRQYAGRAIGVPEGVQLPTTVDSITISGVTVWGYARVNSDGNTEWVMAAPLNPNVVFINNLPGGGGWVVPASRDTFVAIGLALLQVGVPGADLRYGLGALYAAAAAEVQARAAQSQITP